MKEVNPAGSLRTLVRNRAVVSLLAASLAGRVVLPFFGMGLCCES
jgi:hypothetical protein